MILKYITHLERILAERGIKKSWLARQCNRSNNTVTNWIKGRTRPSDDEKAFVAKLLGLTVQEIFFDEMLTTPDNKKPA